MLFQIFVKSDIGQQFSPNLSKRFASKSLYQFVWVCSHDHGNFVSNPHEALLLSSYSYSEDPQKALEQFSSVASHFNSIMKPPPVLRPNFRPNHGPIINVYSYIPCRWKYKASAASTGQNMTKTSWNQGQYFKSHRSD